MRTFLQTFLAFIVPFFAVVSMVSAGLGRSVRDVIGPFRRPASLLAALSANFVLVPLLAYGIARVLRLNEPHAIGLFLLSTAGGAAFLIALVRAAHADLTLATGLLVLLLLVTIAYMPLVIPMVLPWAEVRAMDIAGPLLLTMFLPLALGIAVHAAAPHLTPMLKRWLGRAAHFSLVALFLATFALHFPSIRDMVGTGALGAAFLLTLGAVLIGYTVAGRKPEKRAVLALGTGQRNVAAAMIVAKGAFEDPGPLVMVVVSSLVAFTVLFPTAYLLGRRATRGWGDRFGLSHEEPVRRPGRRAPT